MTALFPSFGSPTGSANPTPPPGPGELGIGTELNNLKNVVPGFINIGKTLLGFNREPGQSYGSSVANLGKTVGASMLQSLLTTALTPVSAVLGSNRFNRLVGGLPDLIRPLSVYDQFRQRGGLIPLLTEDLGNVALAAGPVAGLAGAAADAGAAGDVASALGRSASGAAEAGAEGAASSPLIAGAGLSPVKAERMSQLAEQGSTAAKVYNAATMLQHPVRNLIEGPVQNLLQENSFTGPLLQGSQAVRFVRNEGATFSGELRQLGRNIAATMAPAAAQLHKLVPELDKGTVDSLLNEQVFTRGTGLAQGLGDLSNMNRFSPTLSSLGPDVQAKVTEAMSDPTIAKGLDSGVGLASDLATRKLDLLAGTRKGPLASEPQIDKFNQAKDAYTLSRLVSTSDRAGMASYAQSKLGEAATYDQRIQALQDRAAQMSGNPATANDKLLGSISDEIDHLNGLKQSAQLQAQRWGGLATAPDTALPAAVEAQKYHALGDQLVSQVASDIDESGHVAPSLEPLQQAHAFSQKAVDGMSALAAAMRSFGLETDDIERAVESYRTTLPEVLARAADSGVTPVHFANFSKDMVNRLANANLSLGGLFGRWMDQTAAGARQTREFGVFSPGVGSFRSWVAGTADVLREVHSSNLMDWLDNHIALPYDQALVDSGRFVPYGTEGSAMERLNSMLNAELPSESAQMMPSSVYDALRSQMKDYSFRGQALVAKALDPWRKALLSYSPSFWVKHTIGNLVLGSNAIGPWSMVKNWAGAWNDFRKDTGSINPLASSVVQRFSTPIEGVPQGALGDLAAAGPPAEVLGTSLSHEFQGKVGDILPGPISKQMAQNGKLGLFHTINTRIQNAFGVADEIARTAVFKGAFDKAVGTGALPDAAAAKAIATVRDSLVNYSNLGPFERSIVRSVVPFYAFQKGILKVASNLAIDHPARVGVTMMLGRINRELWDQEKQQLPDAYQSLAPLTPSVWLQTRGLDPFADVESLSTPSGIASSLSPYLKIATDWMFRSDASPFAPKEIGPLGFTQPRFSITGELGDLAQSAALGGLLAPPAKGQPGVNIPQAFGFQQVTPDRIANLMARMQQANQQVSQGLPLPPPHGGQANPFAGLFGSVDASGPLKRNISYRSVRSAGTPLLPVQTSTLFGY